MAITIEQIHATADQLHQQGIKPTQVNVRETLGGGSFSTIAQALKSWRDGSKPLAPQGELVIPKAVTDKANGLIASIWQTAQQEATRQMMIERDIYIAKENALIEQIEELQAVITTLERENEELQKSSHNATSKPTIAPDSSPAPTTPPDPITEPQDSITVDSATPETVTANAENAPITDQPQEAKPSLGQAKQYEADKFAQSIEPIIRPLVGTMTQAKIVDYLNEQGIKSPTGGKWHLSTYRNVLKRLELI